MVLNFLLFFGILIFLIFLKGIIESKFYTLSEQITILNNKIDTLKKATENAEKATAVSFKTVEIPTADLTLSSIFTEFIPKPSAITQEIKTAFSTTEVITDLPSPRPIVAVQKPSFWQNFKEKNPDLEKFIGENLISKIGILILVLGISYFVKYSISKGWISEPVRVGIGILAGSLVLGVAHKLKEKFAAFSSVFVAGAIAIFYFSIGVAFHDYKLFSQEVAFLIMIIITAFAAFITIFYNRLELAIMTLIGGFAVPFMVSTGAGNYAILFTYILIINIGILCIAYFKKWNVLNLLAFAFTTMLFGGWLFNELDAAKPNHAGALIFGFLFYILFCCVSVINNMRTKSQFSMLQMGVISANTFLFYGAGMAILNSWCPEFRGLFTTVLGLFNLSFAYFIFKKFDSDKRVIYLLIGLTLTFITLAIPIQLSGNYITMFWAAEAVMLLWLSQKSNIASYKICSIIVYVMMLFSLILDLYHLNFYKIHLTIIFNSFFITGLVAIASYFMTVHLLKSEKGSVQIAFFTFNPIKYAKLQRILALVIAYFVGLFEVSHQAYSYLKLEVSAEAVTWFYHLLFSSILCFTLLKKQNINYRFIATVALLNIVLFTFYISGLAFDEHLHYIETGIASRVAFCVHYLSLAITAYFGFITYRMYKMQQLIARFYKPIFKWIALFFTVYLFSTELLIHGLLLSNSPVTTTEILQTYPLENTKNQLEWRKSDVASEKISFVRTTIFKSGMPVLWGVLAFILLIIGIRKPARIFRIMALTLLGLTIVKLFLYDIRNASETGRITAFILLGVLILIISFVYQKLKVLLVADKQQLHLKDV